MTGNFRAVQLFLGYTKMHSTVRNLGVNLDDALSLSEEIDLQDLAGRSMATGHVALGDIPLGFAHDVAQSYIMRHISYTKAAIRALRRMPANTATPIRSKIGGYPDA